jgi:hypothetical protein
MKRPKRKDADKELTDRMFDSRKTPLYLNETERNSMYKESLGYIHRLHPAHIILPFHLDNATIKARHHSPLKYEHAAASTSACAAGYASPYEHASPQAQALQPQPPPQSW